MEAEIVSSFPRDCSLSLTEPQSEQKGKGRLGVGPSARSSMVLERLELEFKGELNDACIIQCLAHHPETERCIYVLLSTACCTWQEEVWVVEQVEELRSEFQVHPFPQKNLLDD